VTVGGAALAGITNAKPQRTTAAAMAPFAKNRFMSFLPALTRRTSASPLMRHSRLIVAISRQVSVTDD
jgi:hypothetical protein